MKNKGFNVFLLVLALTSVLALNSVCFSIKDTNIPKSEKENTVEIKIDKPEVSADKFKKLNCYMYCKCKSSLIVNLQNLKIDENVKLRTGDRVKVTGVNTKYYRIKYNNKTYYIRKSNLSKSKVLKNVCKEHMNPNSGYKNKVNKELGKLPYYLLNQFNDDGWKIYVTGGDIGEFAFNGRYGQCLGGTLASKKKIYIEDRDKAVYESVIHEFGHYVDFRDLNNCITNSDKFMKAYNEEQNKLRNTFGITCYWSKREAFAESFYFYFKDREKLKDSCPGMYNIIRESILDIKDEQLNN